MSDLLQDSGISLLLAGSISAIAMIAVLHYVVRHSDITNIVLY